VLLLLVGTARAYQIKLVITNYGLIDFLDHLLEWSGDHAIFLLVLSRPEGTDRKGLGLSRRSITTLPLDPLSEDVIGEMLDSLVSGLPAVARARIVERAEGIPLYAIETVRGLLDKHILDKGDDGALHLVGELGELEIPPGLTALIASRLDALGPDERRLVKECSVLGGSFPRQAIEAISDTDPAQLDELLSSLVRKEVLTVRADKLSPERGHYAFTQSLIRSVAYDMLTRAERKARHLTTAEHLRTTFPDEGAEVAEVIAAHLYDAYKASGEDPDAEELRARACRAYVLAAERAESVGAPEAAETAFLKAVELSSDEAERAPLIERAGRMAYNAGWAERAADHFETAIASHLEAGRVVEAARVTAWLGPALHSTGRGEQGITRIRQALSSLEGTAAPPEVIAELQARLGGALVLAAHGDEATGAIEVALTLAQHHELAEPLAYALSSKANLLGFAGRAEEARAFYVASADVSRRHGITQREMIAEGNLGFLCSIRDLPGAEDHSRAALAIARRWGLRGHEAWAASILMFVLMTAGRLDEAFQVGTEVLQSGVDERPRVEIIEFALAALEGLRGNVDALREHVAACRGLAEGDDPQGRALYLAVEATLRFAEGESRQALETARRVIDEAITGGLGVAHSAVRLAFPVAFEAAIDLNDLREADLLADILAARPRGEVPPFLRAQLARARGLIAAARGEDADVEEDLVAAETALRDLGYPYWLARAQLDRAEWLSRQGRLEESGQLAREAAAALDAIGAALTLVRQRVLIASRAVGSVSGAQSAI